MSAFEVMRRASLGVFGAIALDDHGAPVDVLDCWVGHGDVGFTSQG